MTADRIKALFQDALELPAEQRQAFVQDACNGDAALCRAVEDLLAAHASAEEFLEKPATWIDPAALFQDDVDTERRGDRVGPYELTEKVGQGGFGTVWRARQQEPVVREVAVKIVKLGMDTVEVVRRFAQERDALARMDHPNVAKVLDAGATADGRPWFAMEFVDGEPITAYCDRRRIGIRQRLALFTDVCRAIQHAHHKGIVHRDVKPSNVLVSTRDGKPLPRVIDFGIAKALDRAATEQTLFTTERRLLGTPEYMSPEQVETWGADVDARTDVYSLGVLFYELVAGTRPFDLRRIGAGRFDEVLRRIREQEPERPSARVASLPDGEGREVARARATQRRELVRSLQGDIDWIVLRALEKDRSRRYSTPAQLAADVERCLRNEPVTAGPPSLGYRLGKLARRHRLVFAVAGVAVLSLVTGTVFAVHGLVKARDAEALERSARQRAQLGEATAREEAARANVALAALEDLLSSADPRALHGPDYTVREMLDAFAVRIMTEPLQEPLVQARIHAVIGRTYRQLGVPDAAARHFDAALALREAELPPEDDDLARSRTDSAWALSYRGRPLAAADAMEPVVAHWRADGDPRELAPALEARAGFLAEAGRYAEALADAEEALGLCRAEFGDDHPDTARVLAHLAQIEVGAGRADDAEARLRTALETLARYVPEDHPELLTLHHDLGVVCETTGRYAEAEAAYRKALAGRRRVFGSGQPAVATTEAALGWLLHQRGDSDTALSLLQSACATFRAALGERHPNVARAALRLGGVLTAMGRHAEAIATLEPAVQALRKGPFDVELATARANLAFARWGSGERERAIAELTDALARLEAELSTPHPTVVNMHASLAYMHRELGDVEAARAAYATALSVAREMWPEDHPQVRTIARCLTALQDGR